MEVNLALSRAYIPSEAEIKTIKPHISREKKEIKNILSTFFGIIKY